MTTCKPPANLAPLGIFLLENDFVSCLRSHLHSRKVLIHNEVLFVGHSVAELMLLRFRSSHRPVQRLKGARWIGES